MQYITKIFLHICTIFIISIMFLTLGCKPSYEKQKAREALLNQEVEKTFATIQTLYFTSKTNEALTLIENSLKKPAYIKYHPRFFSQQIELLIILKRIDQACSIILGTLVKNPELAKPVLGQITAFYDQSNMFAEKIKWSDTLLSLDKKLPRDLYPTVLMWQLSAHFSTSNKTGAKATINRIINFLTIEEVISLINGSLENLFSNGQHELAKAMLQHLELQKLNAPPYRDMLISLALKCALAAQDWNQITPTFTICVSQLADAQLLNVLSILFTTLQKNNKTALLDACAQQVIINVPTKNNSVNYASRLWVEQGIAIDKANLSERLEKLLDAKVSPTQVGQLFERYFYTMIDNLDLTKKLCTLGYRIISISTDKNIANRIRVQILDGAFLTKNYDLAIEMLEQGIPEKDKAWHDMTIPKIKAHRALALNQPREAIVFFRQFMNAWIKSDLEEETDPSSGIAYSREWILGRNAIRIANILATIPDSVESENARTEAKAYFKIALKKAMTNPDALKLLQKEVKDLEL